MAASPAGAARHRVVVIGSGFGGLFGTKALRRADVEVTVIAKTTHHLFQPLLYQVATGILSEGEIAPSTSTPSTGVEIRSAGDSDAVVVAGAGSGIDMARLTLGEAYDSPVRHGPAERAAVGVVG